MSQEKLLLIVNPCSGRAKMYHELLQVVEILSNANYAVTVYPTKCKGDATEYASKLSDNDYSLIVVCGGDGTLNEVITGLMATSLNTPIGYIPSGTLNEWSSGLNISRNIEQAAKDIADNNSITLDIGKFGDKYFTYTASFGAFTAASYATSQKVKNVLGQAAYFLSGIKHLGSIKSTHLKFTYDGGEIEGDYLFGAVSNSFSVGSIVKYKKDSVVLNDGEFEVVLIKKPTNILKLQTIINGILKKDFNREGIEFFKTRKLTVESEKTIAWTLDGEFAESNGMFEISNIQNAITFLVPKEKEEKTKKNQEN